jgi:predicted MFS family arabinose efflux permease
MTTSSSLIHAHDAFDGWRSKTISIYMTLVGYGMLVAMPLISAARLQVFGFSEVQIGQLSSADLGGLALGAVLTSWLILKISRRILVLMGAAIAIVANSLSLGLSDYEIMLLIRLVAGIGSGLYTGVAVANLGATSTPSKSYNWMLLAFAFSSALEFHLFPQLSIDGIYIAFIAAFIAGLPWIIWIPKQQRAALLDVGIDVIEGNEHHIDHKHVPAYIVWLCLIAMFLIYTNIGGYWTYIELAALKDRVDSDWINQLMLLSSLSNVVGCLLATRLSNRFGLAKPLLSALVVMAGIVGLLAGGINSITLAISLLTFNLLWIFIDVYQMSFIAHADHSGKFSSLIPCAQGLGQIAGPNIAAMLLGSEVNYSHVFIICAGFSVLAFVTYLGVYLNLQKRLPALANVS